jgi:hypothetical protein
LLASFGLNVLAIVKFRTSDKKLIAGGVRYAAWSFIPLIPPLLFGNFAEPIQFVFGKGNTDF